MYYFLLYYVLSLFMIVCHKCNTRECAAIMFTQYVYSY